ncbi:SMI1/KNR4 family protein [Sphingomonas pruni]|uniref:SMI1/KNR4 family protein n=1 Tax=Sphingomonas pruni TaxID=40683 RepID=UPI000832073A|nr:SMI1/KNR4 family protein [Sphingomonas pruni]
MGWFSGGKKRTDQTRAIFSRHVDGDFTLYPLGEGNATEAEVQALGKSLGVRFPDEFIDHVSGEFPGAIVLAAERVWPRPQPLQVAPFWQFLYGVHSFTPLTTSEDWMRMDVVGSQFQSQTGHAAVPILKRIGDANVYCADSEGHILEFDHEMNTLEPIELGFWALLEREVCELVERKNRLIAERDRTA